MNNLLILLVLSPCLIHASIQIPASIADVINQASNVSTTAIESAASKLRPFVPSFMRSGGQGSFEVFKLPRLESRSFILGSSNDTSDYKMKLLNKLNPFTRLKRRNRNYLGHDLETSDSMPMARFSPYPFSPSPMNPFMSPYMPHPMRFMPYYPSPSPLSYPFTASPFMQTRRMSPMAIGPPRGPFPPHILPSSTNPPVPAFFPLGSMTGTPILDPTFQASLATSLNNRFIPALPIVGGPSLLGSSFSSSHLLDDIDLNAILKRYHRPSKYKYLRDDYDYPVSSSRYSDKYSSRPYRPRDDYKKYDYAVDRPDDLRSEPHDDELRDRPPPVGSPKDSADPHIDFYGWRGNNRKEPPPNGPSIPDPVEDETLRNHRTHDDRYRPSFSESYGSRNPPSHSHDSYVKDSRQDLEAASSSKSRNPFL